MANQVNKGFTPEIQGTELKSTVVSDPGHVFQEKTPMKNGSNNNLLKLAVVLLVILVTAVVVVGVYYAKEVRDNDDNDTDSSTTTPKPTLSRTTSIPTCLDDNCVRSAAGKTEDKIISFKLFFI
jgi:preprotein translocase subunit SecG